MKIIQLTQPLRTLWDYKHQDEAFYNNILQFFPIRKNYWNHIKQDEAYFNRIKENILLEAIHDYIVKNRSIQGIEIEIPPMEYQGEFPNFFYDCRKYKGVGGIYFLYDEAWKLLNIGSTGNLYNRIYQKYNGKNGGSRADFYFSEYYANVAFFCENNERKRKVYEPYLINTLKPIFNDRYNYYDKSIYQAEIQQFVENDHPWPLGYVSPHR